MPKKKKKKAVNPEDFVKCPTSKIPRHVIACHIFKTWTSLCPDDCPKKEVSNGIPEGF